ncbi:chorismate mutase [Sutcliffiella cohnii]|uniref:chorismate mutase n=1 Tax=Sutcliffiella cohnii TaxID=33932 RepID=A0A223KSB7_9BACI|nr:MULTISPECIES: chorismate mutase [Sutcliffiella]AST92248.1 chorismate mutase [Sutcliffiella cohnii]MED4017295.1 chorismate mutase [Sutcliffiella cohnii]WBL13480.1 chorismate mutase [Sutcliffiella sp. NC1]
MIRGIRGATTINSNTENEIVEKTLQLVEKMIQQNEIKSEHVAQVIISVTDEITAAFPAKALRLLNGWEYVPVMCTREVPVPGSLPFCIRVMMTVNTKTAQKEINHIYLYEAKKLRPDLVKEN